MKFPATEVKAKLASRMLKSFANEKRLLILWHLITSEKSVGELQKSMDLSQSALLQHLTRLRRENVFPTRRKAPTIYYTVTSHQTQTVLATLCELYCAEEPKFG